MNDFASHPQSPPPGAMQPPGQPAAPSSAPKVFGVLSIVFSSLVLLVNLPVACWGCVGAKLGNIAELVPPDQELPEEIAAEVLDGLGTIYSIMGLQGLLLLAMSGVLLGIGIGQLKYRRWAASWSVTWGVAGLVVVAFLVGTQFLVIGPAYESFFEAVAKADATAEGALAGQVLGSFGSLVGGSFAFVAAVFYLPYPLLMLIFFRKPNVRAVMIH